jgi:hypothetical protein
VSAEEGTHNKKTCASLYFAPSVERRAVVPRSESWVVTVTVAILLAGPTEDHISLCAPRSYAYQCTHIGPLGLVEPRYRRMTHRTQL